MSNKEKTRLCNILAKSSCDKVSPNPNLKQGLEKVKFWAYCFKKKLAALKVHFSIPETRRLAACTQAVVIMRSTSFIAIELKCSAFEIVRNSIESMC